MKKGTKERKEINALNRQKFEKGIKERKKLTKEINALSRQIRGIGKLNIFVIEITEIFYIKT
jgi:hypothetical protein